MLSQIDTLLGSLSSEEKEVLERKSQISLNRPRKPFIVGTKDRAKRQTRNNAWMFLSEYYGIVFYAPICDQLHSLTPPAQLDTLLHAKRKRESSLSTDDQPLPKRSCSTDEGSPTLVTTTESCAQDKNHDWLKKFFDDSTVPSSSSTPDQASCSHTTQAGCEFESLPRTGSILATPTSINVHQDPCLLLGLYELFKHKRDLFDKLCTELNI